MVEGNRFITIEDTHTRDDDDRRREEFLQVAGNSQELHGKSNQRSSSFTIRTLGKLY